MPSVIHQETKELIGDVSELVGRLGGGSAKEHPRHFLEIFSIFDRCRGLFGAVRLLAESGFGHEALILTRPLFTESLMLMELAAAGDRDRISLVTGWSLASVDDLEGVMREAQSRGEDCSDQLAALPTLRASLEAYARRNGARVRRWRPDEKKLADKHRDGDGYLDFRMSHHFVHGSSFAGEQRHRTDGDVVFVGGPAADQGWAEPAALAAAESVLLAPRAACAIAGWDEPDDLKALLGRLVRIAEAYGGSPSSS